MAATGDAAGEGLARGFAASVAVHALVASAVLVFSSWLDHRNKNDTNTLRVEVFGLIAERQTEQRQLGASQPPPAPQPPEAKPRPEPPKPAAVRKPPPLTVARAPSPVRVEDRPPAEVSPPSQPVVPKAPEGDEQQQIRRTIRDPSEMDLLKLYLVRLKRKLSGKLIYPATIRRSGIDGIVKVGFLLEEDGNIRRETLRVVKSSGSSELDSDALATALATAPFDRPPRSMTIAVDMEYRAAK
jgi:protein TonB